MASSTWPRGFSDRGHLVPAIGTVFGAPAVWFAMLQIGYAQSYSACTGDTHAWLHGTTLGAAVVLAALAALRWQRWLAWRGARAAAWLPSPPPSIHALWVLLHAAGPWGRCPVPPPRAWH